MAEKKYRIALLCENLQAYRNHDIVEHIRKNLYQKDCLLEILVTECNPAYEAEYIDLCKKRRFDGIIVFQCSDSEYIRKQMKTSKIPVLYLCTTEQGVCVDIDEYQAAYQLGEHLKEYQHLMIRYLGSDVKLANIRIEAIKKAYHANKQPHDFAVKITDGSYVNTFERIKEMFAEQLDLLILEDDTLAIPFLKYITEYHIIVPQNVSVVTFAGTELTRVYSPVMTSMMYDYNIYAQDVVSTMIAMIEGLELPSRQLMFQLQKGDSIR